MKLFSSPTFFFFLIALASAHAENASTPSPTPPITPTTPPEVMTTTLSNVASSPEQDRKMAWFREAKYGLFIHWGLYAIPGGVWDGKQIRVSSEWIMAHAKVPVKEYEKLAAKFDPVDFDAEKWVTMAQEAGMKYIVFTAKHGDGFAMYHSQVTPYNIYDATPFHRDPLKELADACARHGMKLGLYYSQAVDWHEPGGFGNTWDFENNKLKDTDGSYDHYLQTKVEPQLKELLTNYGPICEVFFDTPALITPERAQRIAAVVHAAQPNCLIDGRLGISGDYSTMGDNGIPNANVVGDWETPGELNHSWGFDQNDSDYKAPSTVLFNLFDIVSKGGNYLLDVGPTARGVFPPASVANLEAVGQWLKVNGDAIYGTTRSPFAEGFHGFGRKLQELNGKPVELPFTDWRCTAKPGKLYFTIFHWPGEHFQLPAFKNNIQKVYLLSDPASPLTVTTDAKGNRSVGLSHYALNVMATVIVVEIEGNAAELDATEK